MATYNGSVTANTSRYSCYITATESEVNVANNTSKVTVAFHIVRSGWGWIAGSYSGNIKIDGTQYNFSYSPNWAAGSSGDVTIATASKVVTHNADGTKSCAVSAVWNTSGTYSCGIASASGTLALTRILRQANITSAPNFNDEENPTVHYTNPAGNAVTTLQACIAEASGNRDIIVPYRDIPKTGTSYTFNLTESERDALRVSTPNANIKTVGFYVRTVIGIHDVRPQLDRTLTIINANPQFSTFEYKDTNATTIALTGNNQTSIGKYSNIEIKIPSANKMVAKKSANPLKYNAIIGNQSKEILYGSGDVTGTINSANANIISVFAIDSRNNQTRVDKSITNIDYSEPLLQNIRFERKDGVGTTVLVTGGGKYNPVNFGAVANTITNIQYRRKLKSSETWEDWVSITGLFTIAGGTIANKTSNEIIGTTWDLGSEYDVQIRATDKLSTHTLNNLTVNSGNVLMDAVKNKGVSFGRIV